MRNQGLLSTWALPEGDDSHAHRENESNFDCARTLHGQPANLELIRSNSGQGPENPDLGVAALHARDLLQFAC
jgi:hypothetical protein